MLEERREWGVLLEGEKFWSPVVTGLGAGTAMYHYTMHSLTNWVSSPKVSANTFRAAVSVFPVGLTRARL